jgi:hypothetical protein
MPYNGSMSTPILATKLYIPPLRPKIVLRPRLIERLNEGLSSGCKLTLISASAGFGKTTLVSEWIAGCGRPAAWLSLDEGDSDPTRFLTYLIAALRSFAANLGEEVSAFLQSPQSQPTESILTALLNEIAAIPETFIIVLDGLGMGEAADAAEYGDAGSDTLGNVARAVGGLRLPVLESLGLGSIRPLLGAPKYSLILARRKSVGPRLLQDQTRSKKISVVLLLFLGA